MKWLPTEREEKTEGGISPQAARQAWANRLEPLLITGRMPTLRRERP